MFDHDAKFQDHAISLGILTYVLRIIVFVDPDPTCEKKEEKKDISLIRVVIFSNIEWKFDPAIKKTKPEIPYIV